MKSWTVFTCAGLLAILSAGCDATARYKVLSLLFDGVPPPPTPTPIIPTVEAPADLVRQRARHSEHGPYAAHLCNACHDATATNALIVPGDQLCFRCHEFKTDKKYVHGPLASGGCTACHDPHNSRYRYLLVSESDTFCLHCHEPQAVAKNPAHAGTEEPCTVCHDPHMSDKQYLVR
ncbi:MAG TPA: cytochrome c3 family protein [Candidatus Binatia bacterium]|nr:cytochrome c3 family protein [Candidatus Binatia bacterium]